MSYCTIVTSEKHLHQTIEQFDETIVLPRKRATGNIHDYLFWYCHLVSILFEVLRIENGKTNNCLPILYPTKTFTIRFPVYLSMNI